MRLFRWILFLLVLLALGGIVAFRLMDPETRDLDATVRSLVPGRFAHLSDGYTHYELAGPEDGQVVVLAAGSSVPYYIWYPTFKVLVDSGFRVLRYDYYGRGYSDRPDITYDQALYVRQLSELLDSLHITAPINLAGLSFGGSVITSFADRYPARVQRLIYFDPAISRPFTPPTWTGVPVLRDVKSMLNERDAADGQLSDFLHPTRFPDWPTRYRPQLQYRGFRRAMLSNQLNNAVTDQQPVLDRIGKYDRPVMIVWGRQDPTVPFARSAQLLAAFPKALFVPVDSSGHLPQWEQPMSVHPALIGFLKAGS
jgi:pimeloyl-ACP methyl ester carboxylesterase